MLTSSLDVAANWTVVECTSPARTLLIDNAMCSCCVCFFYFYFYFFYLGNTLSFVATITARCGASLPGDVIVVIFFFSSDQLNANNLHYLLITRIPSILFMFYTNFTTHKPLKYTVYMIFYLLVFLS